MTDLDRAIAAARKAMETKVHSLSDGEYILASRSRALRDLLAALDAARGDVRQKVEDTLTDYLDHYPNPEFLDAVMAHFVPAAPPAAADADEDADEDAYVIGRMGKLLAEIAVIVNGPEPPLTRWSYHDLPEKVRALKAHSAPVAVPEGWRVMWFTGSFGSERWEIYDPEGNGGAVDKADVRDDMVRGLLDALATANKENTK